eukprot:1155049-Pelagomonas_calceolata.AAC.1
MHAASGLSRLFFFQVKSHAGIAGNECADAIAGYQANQANNCVADTGIPGAGPNGNPFSHLLWLAKEDKREHTAGTSTASAPNPNITYLPDLQNALKSHMQTKQTWKKEKKRKNNVGRENSPYIK